MAIILTIYASLLALFTLLPFIRNDYWIFRVFDYPQMQKLILTGVGLLLIGLFYEQTLLYGILAGTLSANAVYLIVLIFPYTFLAKKQVLDTGMNEPDNSISIMICNVLQFNHDCEGTLSEVKKADPDVLLLLEIDERWQTNMAELDKKYPFHLKVPQDNTYGLLFYSRLEVRDAEVQFLVEAQVPSVYAKLALRSGTEVQFFGLHPKPPVPDESPRSTERDKELLLVADIARNSNLPVIVAGDLNDVAWSYTTRLFLKMSSLLDPRSGRGFFNTFHAKIPVLRFPLDHAFISPHFKLKSIQRLKNHGSDHFPMFLRLQYEQVPDKDHQPLEASPSDVKLAAEKKAAV